MNLNEAFIKSIKAYFEGASLDEMEATTETKLKYTKEYFDNISKEFGLDVEEEIEKEIKKSKRDK